jgi:ankyrin repeat protein
MLVTQNGDNEIIELLLDIVKIDVDAKDNNGSTPLMLPA